VDLSTADGWAVVGAKGSGEPGDLELYFEVDGVLHGVEFDDLANAADMAPLDVAEHPVTWSNVDGVIEHEMGTIELISWDLAGGFEVTATVNVAGADASLTITASGTFE